VVGAIKIMVWAAETRGAERIVHRIESKANDNAAKASDVRESVASGKGDRRRDPYRRP